MPATIAAAASSKWFFCASSAPCHREDSQLARFNTYGFTADSTHFFGQHWGLTSDVNVAFGSQGGVDFTKTSYFGGVSVPFNNLSGKGVSLFTHALAGGAHLKSQIGPASATSNSFAMKLGGGLDVKVAGHFSLRPIAVDYVPTFFGKSTQHNVSFSFGLAYKWGLHRVQTRAVSGDAAASQLLGR